MDSKDTEPETAFVIYATKHTKDINASNIKTHNI